jgi:cell division initiation protein
MSYTPVELRHVRVSRSLLGYNRAMVEQVIEEVADSFETAWRERGELADKVHALEKQIEELKGREALLTHTLVAAEQAASGVREHAKREAEVILAEAHYEARSVSRAAQGQRERLFAETRRIEALLRAALGMVQEGLARPSSPAPGEVPESTEPVAEEKSVDSWPTELVRQERREDTREFAPISLPPVEAANEHEEHEEEVPQRPPRQIVGGESRDFDWGD